MGEKNPENHNNEQRAGTQKPKADPRPFLGKVAVKGSTKK
jgi:hypothetical protein